MGSRRARAFFFFDFDFELAVFDVCAVEVLALLDEAAWAAGTANRTNAASAIVASAVENTPETLRPAKRGWDCCFVVICLVIICLATVRFAIMGLAPLPPGTRSTGDRWRPAGRCGTERPDPASIWPFRPGILPLI